MDLLIYALVLILLVNAFVLVSYLAWINWTEEGLSPFTLFYSMNVLFFVAAFIYALIALFPSA